MKKIFVIDLMNMAFRAFYGVGGSAQLTNSKGKLTYVCYGVAVTINNLIEEHKPDYIVVAADTKGQTFRHTMYPNYKTGRKPAPPEFSSQIEDLYKMLDAYGIPVLKQEATEADDIIGSLCEKYSKTHKIFIVSSDKDFMQLIGENVKMLKPMNGGGHILIDEAQVIEKFGCLPEKVVDVLAIMGDASDAVPGVKGIGEKGAAELIKSFGSLDGIYENLGYVAGAKQRHLANSRDMAFLSKKLVTIMRDVPVDFDIEKASAAGMLEKDSLREFYKEMEFASLITPDGALVLEVPSMEMPPLPIYDGTL